MNPCEKCPFKGSIKVPPSGPIDAKYVLVGEAPGYYEVRKGKPFVGETGRLLDAFLAKGGLSRSDCYFTNALQCQIPRNVKKDSPKVRQALTCCRDRLLEELDQTTGTVALMGNLARQTLFPYEKGGILAARGWRTVDDRDIYIMAHPAMYLYNPNESPMLVKDLKRLKRGRLRIIEEFEIARAIPLTQGKCTWVSIEDYDYLIRFGPWNYNRGYAWNSNAHLQMHNEVGDNEELDSPLIDHINRNKLDNRRSNLRGVSLKEQNWNRGPKSGTSSQYKGVTLISSGWRSMIGTEAEGSDWLGCFDTEEGAARVYDTAAKERYGEYAYLNFPEPKLEWTAWVLDTKELLEEFIKSLHRVPLEERGYIAFDLETDQVDFQRDRILCMSISIEPGTAYVIPDSLLYEDGHTFITTGRSKKWWKAFLSDERYLTGEYLVPNCGTVALLTEMFAIPGFTWCGHIIKFDLRFLVGQLGVNPPVSIFDTIVAHYTLDERLGGHGLKPLSDDYLDSGDYESELFNYIAKKSGRYSAIPREVLYRYNAKDTELTLRLAHTLTKELKEQGLFERPFKYPMIAAVPMLLAAELRGVAINWQEIQRIDDDEIEPELQLVAAELRDLSGHPDLNPMSSQQMIKIVYDELDFPVIEVRTRAAGKRLKMRSTQVAVVDGWAKMWEQGTLDVTEEAWHFVERLRYYRHVMKMRGSYVRKWQKYHGVDDRVHTSFALRGTVTGRLSSKDPPLQTIPSKIQDKWGPLIANVHISAPGYKLVYADYAQAELMIAACLSEDEFMLNSFRKDGADYHSEVARAAFGDDFTHDDRQHSKRLTFGWLFGGNVYEIALKALQYEGHVAQRFAEEWDRLFHKVVAWRENQGELMVSQGYVESIFGRRRRFPLLSSVNVGKAKRIAMNAPIQSAASDLNLVSAAELYEHYRNDDEVHVILLIHDATVMEVIEHKVAEVSIRMEETMKAVAKRYFPQIAFRADVKVGTRLGDLT